MKNISKYAHLTKDEAINEILIEYGLGNVLRAPDEYVNQKIRNAMEEAFREGWHRGEEYQSNTTAPETPAKRFIDYLKSAVELDCDLIIGNVDMPASFVWNEDSRITEAGYQKFKSLMDANYDVLENGNIEIFCDDDKLGEKFVYAAAGYVSEDNYKAWFEGEWCKC